MLSRGYLRDFHTALLLLCCCSAVGINGTPYVGLVGSAVGAAVGIDGTPYAKKGRFLVLVSAAVGIDETPYGIFSAVFAAVGISGTPYGLVVLLSQQWVLPRLHTVTVVVNAVVAAVGIDGTPYGVVSAVFAAVGICETPYGLVVLLSQQWVFSRIHTILSIDDYQQLTTGLSRI